MSPIEITRTQAVDVPFMSAEPVPRSGIASDLTHPLSLRDTNTARSQIGPVTRIRCNPSDAEEDIGSA
jgi:hypothetical protein